LNRLNLKPNKFFLVSAHREENIDDPMQFTNLVDTLNTLAETYKLPVVISTHPRTRKKLEGFSSQHPITSHQSLVTSHQSLFFLKPLGFFDYVQLQTKARATLSDSGTITEESSILNFPALNIRNAYERPEGMEEGVVMLTGLESERVLQGLEILKSQPRGAERGLKMVSDYNAPNVSDKVLRIIVSYTHYVKRYIWHKT